MILQLNGDQKKEIGEILRNERLAQKKTGKDIAILLNVPAYKVFDIERGKGKLSTEYLNSIFDILKFNNKMRTDIFDICNKNTVNNLSDNSQDTIIYTQIEDLPKYKTKLIDMILNSDLSKKECKKLKKLIKSYTKKEIINNESKEVQ